MILKLDLNEASQSSDSSIKVIKENTNIFSNFHCNSLNNSIKISTFPQILKHTDITRLYKNVEKRYQRKLQTSQHSSNLSQNI